METKKEEVKEDEEFPFSTTQPSAPLFFLWAEQGQHEKIAQLDLALSKAFIHTVFQKLSKVTL